MTAALESTCELCLQRVVVLLLTGWLLLLYRDFVTGFRKRKQQRRKEANKQLEKKAKQQRVEHRAEVSSL